MGDDIDLDEEAERAFQAALIAQGLMPDGGVEEEDDEAERAWQQAQMEAMKHSSESGVEDASAERAWEAARQEQPTSSQLASPYPPHWEGFILNIEKAWEITFADIKFGEQIGVGT